MTRLAALPALPALPALTRDLTGLRQRQDYDLTEEEEESLLGKYARPLLGGLVKVGHVVGTPGSFITGLAAGESEQATEGILDPSKRIYGREMLEKWGVLGPNEPGRDWGDVAGLGVSIALDPLFWTSGIFSGLGAAGRAAKASGLLKKLPGLAAAEHATKVAGAGGVKGLARTVGRREMQALTTPASIIKTMPTDTARNAAKVAFLRAAGKRGPKLLDEPLGGLLNLGPLGAAWKTVGTGPAGQGILRGLDVMGKAVGGLPPVRAIGSLFSAAADGFYNPMAQALARTIYGNRRAADTAAELAMRPLVREIDEFAGKNLVAPLLATGIEGGEVMAQAAAGSVARRMVRHLAEFEQGGIQAAITRIAPGITITPAVERRLIQFVGKYKQLMDPRHLGTIARGGKVGTIGQAGEFGYFARQWDETYQLGIRRTSRQIGVRKVPSMMGRTEELAWLPTDAAQAIMAEPATKAGELTAALLKQNYGQYLNLGKRFDTVDEHATKLAEYVNALPRHVRERGTLFSDDIDKVTKAYVSGRELVNNNMDGIHAFYAANLTDDAVNGMPLDKAFKQLGWEPGRALAWFGDQATRTAAVPAGIGAQRASELFVRPEAVKSATAVWNKLQAPEEWGTLLGSFLDTVGDAFRQHFTLPWAAFHVRNHTSGQAANLLSDIVESPADVLRYGREYVRAWGWMRNPKTMPDEVLDDLVAQAVAAGKADVFMGVKQVGAATDMPANPFALREMFRGQLERIALGRAAAEKAPLGSFAAGTAAGHATLLEAGSRAARAVEFMNRVPAYLLLKRTGWEPTAAAAKVRAVQLDYGALTQFERTSMRRSLLFYSFLRRSGAMVAEQLGERPGGMLSQAIQFGARSYKPGTLVPEYVQSGTAIPRPAPESAEPGTKRYITGLGLMHEDPLSLLGGGMGYEILERINPLFKGPLEAVIGQSFFKRRPLEDLDPTMQRIYANIRGESELPVLPPGVRTPVQVAEWLAINSPASRYLTTLRTFTDRRKGWGAVATNLLTGIRITDVSPRVQESLARKATEEARKQIPGSVYFEKRYLPKEAMARLSPKEQQVANEIDLLGRTLQRRLARRAKLGR